MTIDFFYSDPHFGHDKIVEFCSRPWAPWEQNAELCRRYNIVVGTADTVLWVGDCFFANIEDSAAIMSHLNGKKLLVRGNHDGSPKRMREIGFDLVTEEMLIKIGGKRARVNHFPYWAQRGDHDDRYQELRPLEREGEALIHGHTHSKEKRDGAMVHVGVDAWDYRPASWAEVEELVKRT